MWDSKSKRDLIIEVWEKLDCEDVGRIEIEAIETAIAGSFGLTSTDTPMRLARLLADEGAVLRHSEILELDVERRTAAQDLPLISAPLELDTPESALDSIRQMDLLRQKLQGRGADDSVKSLRQKAQKSRETMIRTAANTNKPESARRHAHEMAEWLSIWLASPDVFDSWISARLAAGKRNSEDDDS